MLNSHVLLVFVAASFGQQLVHTAKLPPYIQQCSRSDPQIAQCFIKNGNAAISTIVKGDKKYRVPEMLPLKIDKISFDPSHDFHIGMEDVKLYGFENTEVIDAKVDLDKFMIQLVVKIPVVTLISKYETKGRLINLNIEGKGDSNITLVGGIYDYTVQLEVYQKAGKDYYRITESKVNYDFDRAYYNYDNLFNGNKQLEDEVNKFMNDNWRELGEEFRPTISKIIDTIINSILGAIVKLVPVEEVFAP